MRVVEIYNREGKKITPRNGTIIERGFALDEAGEWIELTQPATVKVWNEWNNQSQSSDKGLELIFDEADEAEEPVIAEAEKAEPSRDERLEAFEAERVSKEEALIEELKSFSATQSELAFGIERVKSEWRLHDKSEKLAYMVDVILAQREGFRFLKLGEAKNLKSLRSIRDAKMPLSASEQAEQDARLKALNERLQAQEKARLDAEKKSASKFINSNDFAQIVRSNAVFIDAKSRLVPKVFSCTDGDGDTKKVDMGYSEWVYEDAHYSADKTVSAMIKKGIIPSCFYTYLIKPVAEICDELTGERK